MRNRDRLTKGRIAALDRPGLHPDGEMPTLYLRFAPGGSKSWVQRAMIAGKRCDIGLGGYPLVGIDEAREAAFENRRTIRSGGDPLADRRKRRVRVPTFRQAATATYEASAPRIRTEKARRAWLRQLERHAFPKIGDLQVDRITRGDVLEVLTPIWAAKPETARKLRQRVRAIFRWAQAHGHVADNPAGEAIDGALPSKKPKPTHLRALPYADIGEAVAAVDGSGASPAAKLCFRFLVMTAARSGEARGATWDEIDRDRAEWRIPGERMKTGHDHRVPLTAEALAVLDRAREISGGSGLVFPSPTRAGRPLSDMTLTKVLRTVGLADRATVHGFRSSFRDWCAETGKRREDAEAALAHTVGGVEGAYFRSDLFERRRALMQQWADFVTGAVGAKVVPFAS